MEPDTDVDTDIASFISIHFMDRGDKTMGRCLLLWLIGVPLPVLALIWVFRGLR